MPTRASGNGKVYRKCLQFQVIRSEKCGYCDLRLRRPLITDVLALVFALPNPKNLRNLWTMSRGRAARLIPVSPTDVAIPDKLYFRIGEVSELTRTKAFVLRYWETEFSSLRPVKSKSGHRLYRRKDVELIFQIRRLLYEKGFTIEGARRHLASDGKNHRGAEAPVSTCPGRRRTQSHPAGIADRVDNTFAEVLA